LKKRVDQIFEGNETKEKKTFLVLSLVTSFLFREKYRKRPLSIDILPIVTHVFVGLQNLQ